MEHSLSSAMPAVAPAEAARLLDRPQRLSVLASRLSRTIGLARALAQNGRTLDLTGIDDGIGMLCAQTLDLDTRDARQMLPLLHEVLGQVNALTAALHEAGEAGPRPASFRR